MSIHSGAAELVRQLGLVHDADYTISVLYGIIVNLDVDLGLTQLQMHRLEQLIMQYTKDLINKN